MTTRQQKIIDQLKSSINEGEFYEAHQRCRTLIPRMLSKKQYSESFELLKQINQTLFDQKHLREAADLAIMYLETFKKANESATLNLEDHFENLSQLYANMTTDLPEFEKFRRESLKKLQK